MMEFSNNIFHRRGIDAAPSLTPLQSQVDGLVGGFTQQATDWRSLAAMMAGGMTYRLGRVGAMATGTGRLASLGVGLGAEVTAFEMTNRSLSSLTGENHLNHNLWRWDGQGGIRQGLLSSLVTFGTLKGAGRLAQGENVVVQHLLQDTGMVLGHQVSASFGITDRPQGTLAEQFLHAEATNLQLGAGMSLAHSFAPGIQGLERGLDLSLRATEAETQSPRLGEEISPLQNGLQPAFAAAGGVRDHILAMSSIKGNGEGGGSGEKGLPSIEGSRSFSRGEPTLTIVTHWDPYRIEGMPEDAERVKIEGTPQNLAERIFEEVCRNLNQKNPRPMVIGLEIDGVRELKEADLESGLMSFLRDRHRERPIPEGVPIALAIPSKHVGVIIQNEGGVLRLRRTFLDPSGSITFDDTPDESAEASAEQARQTLPHGVPVAATIMQTFEAMKAELEKGGDVLVQYEGILWSESTAPTFAKWFKTGAHQLAEGRTAAIEIPRMGQRILFSREGNEVSWKVELLEGIPAASEISPSTGVTRPSPPPLRKEPSPIPPPGSDRPRSPSPPPPSEGGRPSRRTPRVPAGVPESSPAPDVAMVLSDPIHLISRISGLLRETEGNGFDLIYTGERRLNFDDQAQMVTALGELKEAQRIRIHQTRFQEVIELRKEGGQMVPSPSASSWAHATFATHSVSDWGELFQRLVHFLPPYRTEIRNPEMIYRGRDWVPASVFAMLVDFLSDHPIAAGQTITIKQGRGESEIRIQRSADQILVRIQSGAEAPLEFILLPDPKNGRLLSFPFEASRSYTYQPLADYHQEAAELVKKGLGKRNIGTIIGRAVDTVYPVETLIQAPSFRGRLLAEVAKEALSNRDIPRYHDQWLTIHRFIEKAYSFLDLETVEVYQKHMAQQEDYRSAIQVFNEKAGNSREKLTSLEEMPVDLPGAALLPKWFSLRDAMVRQINEDGRSIRENRVFLRDAERMGEVFGITFNNRVGILSSFEDFLLRRNPPQVLNDLLKEEGTRDAESLEMKKQILSVFEELPDYLRILTSGRGAFQRDFLRSALYSERSGIKKTYLHLAETLSGLSPAVRGRYSLRNIPTLEDLEALIQPSSH
jgi:hypothetical protein